MCIYIYSIIIIGIYKKFDSTELQVYSYIYNSILIVNTYNVNIIYKSRVAANNSNTILLIELFHISLSGSVQSLWRNDGCSVLEHVIIIEWGGSAG